MVLDLLAERVGGRFKAHKGRADVVEGRLVGLRAPCWPSPSRYMNLSGGPVASLRDFFKVPVERIVVVHDELDIPYGALRLKRGGGDNGHNGLRSHHLARSAARTTCACASASAARPGRQDPADFVLKDFSGAERKDLGVPRRPGGRRRRGAADRPLEAAQNAFHVDPA